MYYNQKKREKYEGFPLNGAGVGGNFQRKVFDANVSWTFACQVVV